MDTTNVRVERTNWRDAAISARHRLYGFDCPATDIDFLLVEYNAGRPAALVEYKAVGAWLGNIHRNTLSALRLLADAANIPFLLVMYDARSWCFTVYPHNRAALAFVQTPTTYSERDYVRLLYRMRGIDAPSDLLARLNERTR